MPQFDACTKRMEAQVWMQQKIHQQSYVQKQLAPQQRSIRLSMGQSASRSSNMQKAKTSVLNQSASSVPGFVASLQTMPSDLPDSLSNLEAISMSDCHSLLDGFDGSAATSPENVFKFLEDE